ncbi:PREDICTED: uncharacterized protein LOC101295247 [Fragaria vesca subsp. vesca]
MRSLIYGILSIWTKLDWHFCYLRFCLSFAMHFRLLGGLSLLDSYKSDPYGMTTILDICQDLKEKSSGDGRGLYYKAYLIFYTRLYYLWNENLIIEGITRFVFCYIVSVLQKDIWSSFKFQRDLQSQLSTCAELQP